MSKDYKAVDEEDLDRLIKDQDTLHKIKEAYKLYKKSNSHEELWVRDYIEFITNVVEILDKEKDNV